MLGMLLGGLGSYQAQKYLGMGADEMKEVGERAWEAGQYTPYGVTTGLGAATFEDGQAQYTLDPRYAAQQEQMLGLGEQAFGAAGGDYDALAQQMFERQRALGADTRATEAKMLGEQMFGSGRRGLQVSGEALGAGTGAGMLSPDALEFSRAFAEQEAADRAASYEQAQQQRLRELDIGTSMLGQSMGLDQAGLQAMELGGMFGSQQSAAANAAAQNLINAYTTRSGLLARQGQSIAGSLGGLGSSLGTIDITGAVGGLGSAGNALGAWRSTQGGVDPMPTSLRTPTIYGP